MVMLIASLKVPFPEKRVRFHPKISEESSKCSEYAIHSTGEKILHNFQVSFNACNDDIKSLSTQVDLPPL